MARIEFIEDIQVILQQRNERALLRQAANRLFDSLPWGMRIDWRCWAATGEVSDADAAAQANQTYRDHDRLYSVDPVFHRWLAVSVPLRLVGVVSALWPAKR